MNFYKHETGEDFLSRIKKKHWSSRNRFVIPAILKFKTSVHHIMILKELKGKTESGRRNLQCIYPTKDSYPDYIKDS